LPQLTPSLARRSTADIHDVDGVVQRAVLFGGDVRMLTLEIFTARQRGDFAMAITETVILAIISLGALIFFQRYEGTRRLRPRR
jgi:ABC-type sulfate transport system permease component